jgi:gliding motility-associated-like protein
MLFGHVKQYHFSIYNRWGQLIFQTKELNKGWDGKMQNTGVFLWTCTYQFEGEAIKNERGTILLIK